MAFQKATRKRAKLKIALIGPSGSGKTYSALLIAKGMGGRVAVIDTERGSASLYSHLVDFDVDELQRFEPEVYIEAIKEAVKNGYSTLIIDSLSHEWEVTRQIAETGSTNNKNKMAGWAVATPRHQKLIDTILQSPLHVICNMRSKTEWSMEKDENGKTKPVKVGLAPVQRPNVEYEFTTIFNLSSDDNSATVEKDRTEIFENFRGRLNEEVGNQFLKWLETGEENPAARVALERQKKLTFVLLSKLDQKYEDEKVRRRFFEISGKDSMKLWTEEDANKINAALEEAILKIEKDLKMKKEKAA